MDWFLHGGAAGFPLRLSAYNEGMLENPLGVCGAGEYLE